MGVTWYVKNSIVSGDIVFFQRGYVFNLHLRLELALVRGRTVNILSFAGQQAKSEILCIYLCNMRK